MLCPPERALCVVALRELGDAGAERDTVSRRPWSAACSAPSSASASSTVAPARTSANAPCPRRSTNPLPTLVGKLPRDPAERRVHRLAVDALRELLETFEAEDDEHSDSPKRCASRPRGRACPARRAEGRPPLAARPCARRSGRAAARRRPLIGQRRGCGASGASGLPRRAPPAPRRARRAATPRAPPRSSSGSSRARASPLREAVR